MKKLFLLAGLLFLVACGPNEEQVFEDAIDTLEADLINRGYDNITYPDYEMAEVEETGDNQYKVSGMVEEDGYGNEFYVKLIYKDGSVDSYEWYIKP